MTATSLPHSPVLAKARSSRLALQRGHLETALEELGAAREALDGRRGRREEIDAIWKAARALVWATRRIPGPRHLAWHGRRRPDRAVVDAARFDVSVILDIAESRLREEPRGRRWFRGALRDLARREDPESAWRRLVHLAARLVRADGGAIARVVEDGSIALPAAVDARGVPLPRTTIPVPAGAVRSCVRRGCERLPGWRERTGGRILVVPLPDGESSPLAMILYRIRPAPRFGEDRRMALRAFLRRAGPTAADVARRVEARAQADRRRKEERDRRIHRAQARARHRRYLQDLGDAKRDQAEGRALLRHPYERIVGAGGTIGRILRNLDRVIPTMLPILVLGETGTGKELVARALHEYSPRSARPFVSVNASAIPEALVEAELFGARRGAYTGAERDRRGRLQEAQGGTFFLDEIGEMSLDAQAKLLRVLEGASVRPLGGGREYRADVRLIAATHRDLQEQVAAGRFREDLFHRIHVVPVELPPLRERPEDLVLLVEHFLTEHSRGAPPAVTEEAMERIRCHRWPGNVRELEMCLRVALVLCEGPQLLPEHIRIYPLVPGSPADDGRFRDLAPRLRRLLEEWPPDRPIRCGQYQERYGLSRRTATRDLANLVEEGFLVRYGKGPGTRYERRVSP